MSGVGGNVYTAIIEEQAHTDSIICTDTFRSYNDNALDVSDFHHRRINHSELFADQGNHIIGIENFWDQTKRHKRKFNGIKSENFIGFFRSTNDVLMEATIQTF